jgi:hypothetical protein
MVFNATSNNISVITWRSVLLVEETGVLGENHRPATSHRQTILHNDSQPQVKKFTSYLPMVAGSLRVLRLLTPLKLVATI